MLRVLPSVNQNVLVRYFPNKNNEANEVILESMLGIMSILSNQYFKLIDRYYCRSVVWIETGNGENHLICTASMHPKDGMFHAEEAMAKAIYQLYKNDAKVVQNGSQLHIKKMYIDIEPCDGERYRGHHCQQFFNNKGRSVEIDGTKVKLSIHSSDRIYWNGPLPPKDGATQCRSQEIERDQGILGVNLGNAHINIKHWQKCYIVKANSVKPEEVDLRTVFSAQLKENEVTPEVESLKEELLEIIRSDKSRLFSESSANLINQLANDECPLLFNKFLKAVIKSWSLTSLKRCLEFTSEHVKAIRELQSWQYKQSIVLTDYNAQLDNEPLEKNIPKKRAFLITKGDDLNNDPLMRHPEKKAHIKEEVANKAKVSLIQLNTLFRKKLDLASLPKQIESFSLSNKPSKIL